MDSKKPDIGGQPPNDKAGKKKKNKNKPGNTNQSQGQDKHDQPNQPEQQQPAKPNQDKTKNIKQQPPQQKQDQQKHTKQQPAKQKQNQPNIVHSEKAQNKPTDQTSYQNQSEFAKAKTQRDPKIEQQISLLLTKLSIPKKKNIRSGGTLGRKTHVDVNYLPLNLDKLFTKTVYHMDVHFVPELPKKLLRNALEEFVRIHYPKVNVAFDGRKNMYTTVELKGKSGVVTIPNDYNRVIDFTITTSLVKVISMSKIADYMREGSSNKTPGEAFQALDIVLKNRPFALRFTNVGRSFFPVPRITPVDLGDGIELWKGFFQSPVIGWKPFLNIDVAHKGFPKFQPLTTYISVDMKCNLNIEMDRRNLNALTLYVKGLKVDFMLPNQPNTKRSFKVVGLLDTAQKFEFVMDDNKKLNVVQYFKTNRNYTIRYPNLPCLHVGNVNKKTAIPIELCTVQRGQTRLKKLSESQTSNMVKYAARPPSERRKTIENCITDIQYNTDNVLKDFGIEVGNKFTSVPARVLEQPSLAYKNKEAQPSAGVWKADKFSVPIFLKKWTVLNIDSMRTKLQAIKDFEQCLIQKGREYNVIVNPMDPPITLNLDKNCKLTDIKNKVIDVFNKTKNDNVQLVCVVFPEFPPGIYAAIKQASELTVGVLTQCIKSKTIFKMNPSTSGNILLKINSKLNGINHTLGIKSSPPCMKGSIIFGADVTHPSPDQTSIPSVAAVAASHDFYGSQYNMEWRLQSPRVEIIAELEDIVHKQLIKYKERTNSVPKKIFYFRDGVSEGQFLQLLEHELVSIRRACMRLSINYQPPVTFLVVQKRHHTRMFPVDAKDMDGKFANVPSGTIIDTQITHPTELDFYLCSHASIQGTSRPTKYHLIWDDNNLTEDELEKMTFYLCFMFARCTRSVSYPAPTYYAHLAAFRARAYIENNSINIDRLETEQSKTQLNEMFIKNTPMFFV